MVRAGADGLVRMRGLVEQLPAMLVDGYRLGRERALPRSAREGRLFACGVGGSAAAADLAGALFDAEAGSTLDVVRGSELPKAVGPGSRVVVVSYSGETREALDAYDTAGRRGASRLVVTSGGTLGERAEADDVPTVVVPGGLPPRAAVGSLLGAVLGALDPEFPESNQARVERAARAATGRFSRLAAPNGPAEQIAREIGLRMPFFVTGRALAAVGRRWVTQLEENAKRLAVALEVPELLHNAVVAWDDLRRTDARRFALVSLREGPPSPALREGWRELERIARSRGVRTIAASVPGDDLLEVIVHAVVLGDLVSLALARRAGVDPLPIVAIDRLRGRMARAPAGRR